MSTTVIETRFDAVIRKVSVLEAVVPFSQRPQVREVVDELVKIRRDLSGIEEPLAAPPVVQRPEGSMRNLKQSNHWRHTIKQRADSRHCPRHDDGEGAWLPVEAFGVKNRTTGALRSWCTDCTKEYQRERYVRTTATTVTVELHEDDFCVGHDCPDCHQPFEAGQRVLGADLRHETCAAQHLASTPIGAEKGDGRA